MRSLNQKRPAWQPLLGRLTVIAEARTCARAGRVRWVRRWGSVTGLMPRFLGELGQRHVGERAAAGLGNTRPLWCSMARAVMKDGHGGRRRETLWLRFASHAGGGDRPDGRIELNIGPHCFWDPPGRAAVSTRNWNGSFVIG